MREFNSDEQLFVFEKEKWTKHCQTPFCLPMDLNVQEIENGIILPLKKRTDLTGGNGVDDSYEGGVCDENGDFVTGIQRALELNRFVSRSCLKGYKVDKGDTHRHETVVFGGILFEHFGHYFMETFARLWWYVENQDTPYKIVFLLYPASKDDFPYPEVFDSTGIPRDKIEVITAPVRFDKIIIPDVALYLGSGYINGYEKIHDLVISHAPPSKHKKIYLSRTRFHKKDILNEEYFEEFYKRRGFYIVYPEQLSFLEQVSLIHGADEVVTTVGTLQLLMVYCREGTKVTIFNRTDIIMNSTILPLLMRNLDYSIVDIDFNIFPAPHIGTNVYLCGPTRYWIDYLNTKGIAYEEDEVSLDINLKPLLYDYLLKWSNHYVNNAQYKRVASNDLIDVVANIQKIFYEKRIDKKAYAEKPALVKMRKEKDNFKKECDKVKKERDNLNKEITLFKKDRDLHKKDRDLAIKEGQLFKKERDAHKKQLDKLTKEQAKLKEENKKLKDQNKKVEKRIKSMENSHSWKITAPIRFILDLLKR